MALLRRENMSAKDDWLSVKDQLPLPDENGQFKFKVIVNEFVDHSKLTGIGERYYTSYEAYFDGQNFYLERPYPYVYTDKLQKIILENIEFWKPLTLST